MRLSPATREFALESLNGKYGAQAWEHYAVSLPQGSLDGLSEYEKYDACIKAIAENAPLRYVPGELLSGSATLGMAITHQVPALCGGKAVMPGVSHLTLGYKRILALGLDGIQAQVEAQLAVCSEEELPFMTSLKRTAESMRLFIGRYTEYLSDVCPENAEILKKVPCGPAATFREAIFSLWFTFAFTRLCGVWSGIGRIDEMLGGYLHADLQSGKITLEEARELVAHFFIKGCEWIRPDTPAGSGDAQHYQNIVLSGCDADGGDITNEMTYLVLDTVEELPIGDFPITVRISESSDKRLLDSIARTVRHGGGAVAVYGEQTVLSALTSYGYDLKEARGYANDGCWEVQIPGRTSFSYMPFDALQILLNTTLGIGGEHKKYDDFEELYIAYINDISSAVAAMDKGAFEARTREENGRRVYNDLFPCSVVGLLEEDCIKNHRGYFAGGTKYNVLSPHIGGAPDAANSLYAVKKLVFDEKITTYDTLLDALEHNWEGYEPLRAYAANRYTYYGNDSDECDGIFASLLDDFAAAARSRDKYDLIRFPPGVSTFGRQIEWAPFRAAAPFGTKKGEILSGNASPTPGYDKEGATAVIRSYCKADLTNQTTGAALDVRLHPDATEGEEGIEALVSLMRGFCALGGFFMQTDVADANTLRAAQKDPELYRTLSVRVSGWNARFITLDKNWQEMIIERTEGKRT